MDKPAVYSASTNFRVLHVDDEPMICDVTRLCLEREGRFKVDIVHSAEEALGLLKQFAYACVISDYEMPNMNGIELLREIRSFDQEIPFILFSGRGREAVIIDAINTGADFYIQKGGDAKSLFAELNHKVDYAISKRNARISLKRRDAILEAVSLVATLFLGGEAFHRAISESVTLFGLATEVDRVMAYRLEEKTTESSSFHCLCSWSRPEIIPTDDYSFPVESFPFVEKIINGEMVIGSAGSFDSTTRDLLKSQDIKSVAIFPVIAEQKIRGMIWFCDCLSEREWAVVEVDALQAAAAIIGSAIYQDEMNATLVSRKEQYESMYSMMRQLCDTVPDMLWAKDLKGRYIFLNKETATGLLGVPNTESPIGRMESDFCTSVYSLDTETTNIENQEESSDKTETKQKTARFEKVMSVNGQTHELEIRKVPFYDQGGELIGTVAVGRDITDERKVERIVLSEQKKYSRIFHSIHIGLISCLPGGEISDINRRAADLLAIEYTNRTGLSLHDIPGLRDTDLLQVFSESITRKRPVKGKGKFTDSRGNTRLLYYEVAPQYDDNFQLIDLLLTIDEHYQD